MVSRNAGFTLIELIVTIIILMIILSIAALEFRTWITKAAVDRETQELFNDMTLARYQSMTRNRLHFLLLTSSGYSIVQDSNDNGSYDAGTDAVVRSNTGFKYPLSWSDSADTRIDFNARGLSEDTKTICVSNTVGPAYDCILLARTRINLGKLQNGLGACDATNCQSK